VQTLDQNFVMTDSLFDSSFVACAGHVRAGDFSDSEEDFIFMRETLDQDFVMTDSLSDSSFVTCAGHVRAGDFSDSEEDFVMKDSLSDSSFVACAGHVRAGDFSDSEEDFIFMRETLDQGFVMADSLSDDSSVNSECFSVLSDEMILDNNFINLAIIEQPDTTNTSDDFISRLCKGISDDSVKQKIQASFKNVAENSREPFVQLIEWLFAQDNIREVNNNSVVESYISELAKLNVAFQSFTPFVKDICEDMRNASLKKAAAIDLAKIDFTNRPETARDAFKQIVNNAKKIILNRKSFESTFQEKIIARLVKLNIDSFEYFAPFANDLCSNNIIDNADLLLDVYASLTRIPTPLYECVKELISDFFGGYLARYRFYTFEEVRCLRKLIIDFFSRLPEKLGNDSFKEFVDFDFALKSSGIFYYHEQLVKFISLAVTLDKTQWKDAIKYARLAAQERRSMPNTDMDELILAAFTEKFKLTKDDQAHAG
jgi:hypothetical protein